MPYHERTVSTLDEFEKAWDEFKSAEKQCWFDINHIFTFYFSYNLLLLRKYLNQHILFTYY
jgi:hypothetical protein